MDEELPDESMSMSCMLRLSLQYVIVKFSSIKSNRSTKSAPSDFKDKLSESPKFSRRHGRRASGIYAMVEIFLYFPEN